jgi:hypothetical protein
VLSTNLANRFDCATLDVESELGQRVSERSSIVVLSTAFLEIVSGEAHP